MSNCGACDLGKWHFCNHKNQFVPKAWVDQRVPSEHHSHDIVPWAVEENCRCGYPASHKVAEEGTNPALHPLTAYVCCEHFWGFCHNTKVIMKTMDDHTRGAETLDEVPEVIQRRYQLTRPKQLPSQRPDPVGPVDDYANGHTYDRT